MPRERQVGPSVERLKEHLVLELPPTEVDTRTAESSSIGARHNVQLTLELCHEQSQIRAPLRIGDRGDNERPRAGDDGERDVRLPMILDPG